MEPSLDTSLPRNYDGFMDASTPEDPGSSDRRRLNIPTPLRTVIVLVLVGALAALAVAFIRRSPGPEPLDSLAAYVGAHGNLAPLAPATGRFFGIPGESIVFTQCSVISESGRTRSIGVRVRPELHYIDILLIDTSPGVEGANFYLTTTDGKLVQSAHLDTELRKIDDAEQRFQHELGFWLKWHREKMSRQSAQ